jgi:hypothetical protein
LFLKHEDDLIDGDAERKVRKLIEAMRMILLERA